MKKVYVYLSILLAVAGCTTPYATNQKSGYLESRNGPNLEVPSPLTRANISGFYDLPTPQENQKVSVVPPKS